MVLNDMRPEIAAGGYARDNGGIQFFSRVNALLKPGMTVIDLGAGRGTVFHSGIDGYYERLARLQGKVARVIGLDVDDAIKDHPHLDERHVIAPSAPFPVASNSVDVVVADWVLEHVADPANFAAEIERVLKPGGWLCARTPNRWGYVGIGARLIPNTLHTKLLNRLWPERHDVDVFPVTYRLNSQADIRRYFPKDRWRNCSYMFNATPRYASTSKLLFRLVELYQAMVPKGLKTDFLIFVQRL